MKELIIVLLMATLAMTVAPKAKHCESKYKNTLQHDIYRECK